MTVNKPYTPPETPEAMKEAARLREVMQLERRVDTAYTQRNNAAVALVRMALLLGWPAGRGLDDKTENDLAWRHVVYLDLPNGEQVSYHMAPADVPLLDGLPEYTGQWDGKFTGTTAWAEMVPKASERCTWCGGPEFDPSEVDRLMQGVPEGETVQVAQLSSDAWPKRVYSGPPSSLRLELPEYTPVPKAPFPPGLCACPGCDQRRAVGKLFCALHRSVDSRVHRAFSTSNEQLAYMMQRDGEQQ